MDTTDLRTCRSLLFLPASNPRAIEKARALPADLIILDLEDSVRAFAIARGFEAGRKSRERHRRSVSGSDRLSICPILLGSRAACHHYGAADKEGRRT